MFGMDVRFCANMRFAVTDIETTGSHASGNSIIEIGIVVYDGESIVEEFSSLVDPGIRIPSYITGLTGITNDMLQGAPAFHQIADRLEEIFDGALFVAHNVNFDHSFIRAEFAAIGINWNPARLCTMRMARKAFPGQKSYGLNAICSWMDLTNEHAHRALSDARVASEILMKALPLIDPGEFKKMVAKQSGIVFLPPNLPEDTFNRLPEAPGVYYLYNEKGKPLYIGKANNIKKRVKQHFTTNAESARAQSFMREVRDVGFELAGNELIALLLEDAEIRMHWPPHNSAQKRKTRRVQVIQYLDQKGYNRLAAGIAAKASGYVKSFASLSEANRWLYALASEFGIDQRLLGLSMFDVGVEPPQPETHNHRLEQAIAVILARDPSFVISGQGRKPGEYGYVWVERGVLKGYAFLEDEITSADDLFFHLKPLPHSENTNSILDAFSSARWGFKRIDLMQPEGHF
jgi:DNA polymerase-3 subunit epsilon